VPPFLSSIISENTAGGSLSWDYEQIAAVLDISVQAVNGRLIRAKRKIAKYLKRNGLTGDDYETS